jgi:hypothetical protein
VHGDVQALLNAGILQKSEDGFIIFPFNAVRVDIMLHTALLRNAGAFATREMMMKMMDDK